MSVMRTIKPSFNRRALATQAMQAATATRGSPGVRRSFVQFDDLPLCGMTPLKLTGKFRDRLNNNAKTHDRHLGADRHWSGCGALSQGARPRRRRDGAADSLAGPAEAVAEQVVRLKM